MLAPCGDRTSATHTITVCSVTRQTVKQLCALFFSFLLDSNIHHCFQIEVKFHSSLNDWFYGNFDLNSRWDQGNKMVNNVWPHACSVPVVMLLLSLINTVKEEINKGVGEKVVVGVRWGSDCRNIGIDLFSLIPPINYIKDSIQSRDGKRKAIFAGSFFPFPLSWWHSASCISSIWVFPAKKCTEINVEAMLL